MHVCDGRLRGKSTAEVMALPGAGPKLDGWVLPSHPAEIMVSARRGSPFGRCRCSPLPVLVLAASKLVAMAGAGSVFFESSKRFLPSVE